MSTLISRRKVILSLSSLPFLVTSQSANAQAVNTVENAKPFAQTKTWSCWAAAAVILLRWKDGMNYSELDVATMAGNKYKNAFTQNTGLLGSDIQDFANKLGLTTEAPQNFTPGGYESLIKNHGPIWVAADLGSQGKPRGHVRVLRGVTGDGTFNGSTAWVLDPDGGHDSQITVTQFAQQMEQIARAELDAGGSLYPQVIRFAG